jgi:hypothetical protein
VQSRLKLTSLARSIFVLVHPVDLRVSELHPVQAHVVLALTAEVAADHTTVNIRATESQCLQMIILKQEKKHRPGDKTNYV